MAQRVTAMPEFTPFGTAFQPIGYINGKAVWPVIGGADGDGNEGSGGTGNAGNEGGSGQGGQGDSGNGNDGTEDGSESQGDGSGEKTYTEAEFQSLKARMQAADRAKAAAEAEVKKREDAERTELEKIQAENEELKKRDSERNEEFRTLQTKDAFRDASKAHKPSLEWHNPVVALRELDKDLITVDNDGSVKGMEAAVKKLANDHPYLVKESDAEGGGQASGGSFNGKKTSNTKTNDKAALARKFPALRGRGGNLGT